MKPVKFIRSKLIAAGAAGGLFVAVWAWAAAAGWQGAPASTVVADPAAAGGAATAQETIVQRVYLVQRTAPDGSTYVEALPAAPADAAASVVQPQTSSAPPRTTVQTLKPVTKTRAS